MKKVLVFILALSLVLSFSLISFAEDDIVISEDHIRTWFCWVQDGDEVTLNKVKTSDRFIVKDLSSNWVIKAQNSQSKITDTYWSPATVWTVDATKDFELAFEVFGNTKVEIGFLHCVGASSSGGVNYPVSADGHELVQWCKLYESADGVTWTEVDSDILPATHALVSGMTDYDAEDITPYNGDGVSEYSEAYFVISGTVSANAKYVKYWFKGNGRNHYWDPCVRDAIFTAPVGNAWEGTSEPEESSEPEPVYNPWINLAKDCSYEVLSGTVRNDGYGDPQFTKLTDGYWSVYGDDNIGAFDSPAGSIKLDLGSVQTINRIAVDMWYGAWGIAEPVSVKYSISDDGENFTEIASVANSEAQALTGSGTFTGYLYQLDFEAGVSGRYIKVEYTASSHVWTSEIGVYKYVPEETSEPVSEVSTPSESSQTTTPTGDAGYVALALVSVIALAGIVVIKRR